MVIVLINSQRMEVLLFCVMWDAFWSTVKCQVNQSSGNKQNPQTLEQKGHLLLKKWKTIVGCLPKAQLFALEEEPKSPNAWVECL